jgi:hypothetical protein
MEIIHFNGLGLTIIKFKPLMLPTHRFPCSIARIFEFRCIYIIPASFLCSYVMAHVQFADRYASVKVANSAETLFCSRYSFKR